MPKIVEEPAAQKQANRNKYKNEINSKEYKEITFTSYDIDTLSKVVHTCTNTVASDNDSSIFKEDVIDTFVKI